MGLSYQHLLIPISLDYRPAAPAVASLIENVKANGYVASDSTVAFFSVSNEGPRFRQVLNPFTGETSDIQCSSRVIQKLETLTEVAPISQYASKLSEYDVSIVSEGVPQVPPLLVGYIENKLWKPLDSPYHLEIRCRLRSRIVRLYHLESPEDLHKPPDLTKYSPRFDEDCSGDESDGLFTHPELETITIPNAGCASFWIEFNYGKFVFPRLKDGGVDVLDDKLLALANTIFETEFVQACLWG